MNNTPDSYTLTVEQLVPNKNLPDTRVQFISSSGTLLRRKGDMLTLSRRTTPYRVTDARIMAQRDLMGLQTPVEVITVSRMDGNVIAHDEIKEGDEFVVLGNAQAE